MTNALLPRGLDGPAASAPWVVALVGDTQNARQVLSCAFDEAYARGAAVMVLAAERRRCEVERIAGESTGCTTQVWAAPIPDDIPRMFLQASESEHVVVVGADDGALIDRILCPSARYLLRNMDYTVVVLPTPPRGISYPESEDHCLQRLMRTRA